MGSLQAVLEVECSNCGGSDWTAIVALAIAGVGLVIALIALRMNLSQHEMSSDQYAAFLEERNARAVLRVTLKAVDHSAAGGTDLITTAKRGVITRRVEIGIENVGDKAARDVTVNLLAPQSLESLRWSDQQGGEVPGKSAPLKTAEELIWDDGRKEPARFLADRIDVVTRSSTTVRFASAMFTTPQPGGTFRFPFRLRVECDDMDETEVLLDWQLRIRSTRDEAG